MQAFKSEIERSESLRYGNVTTLCSDGQKLTKKLITNNLIYLF